MREERGHIRQSLTIREEYTLWGTIGGDVRVGRGGKMYVRGTIYGNLRVDPHGRVHVYGNVTGILTVMRKSKVIVSGIIGGDAVNEGGRLFIDTTGKVMGKVKTNAGQTEYQLATGEIQTPTATEVRRWRDQGFVD
jgi:hypothetical protein